MYSAPLAAYLPKKKITGDSRWDRKVFLLSKASRSATSWLPGVLSLGMKRWEQAAECLPPPIAAGKGAAKLPLLHMRL
jgi:hypothetical protein